MTNNADMYAEYAPVGNGFRSSMDRYQIKGPKDGPPVFASFDDKTVTVSKLCGRLIGVEFKHRQGSSVYGTSEQRDIVKLVLTLRDVNGTRDFQIHDDFLIWSSDGGNIELRVKSRTLDLLKRVAATQIGEPVFFAGYYRPGYKEGSGMFPGIDVAQFRQNVFPYWNKNNPLPELFHYENVTVAGKVQKIRVDTPLPAAEIVMSFFGYELTYTSADDIICFPGKEPVRVPSEFSESLAAFASEVGLSPVKTEPYPEDIGNDGNVTKPKAAAKPPVDEGDVPF